MSFTLDTYATLRPVVWHLTRRENLSRIRECGELLPAGLLLDDGPHLPRRGEMLGRGGVRIRNQDLLNEKSVELEAGTFADFVENLNRRVFFWSGHASSPVRPGRRAWEQYASTDAVLRIPFADISFNHVPEFAACNSGATRMQGGRRVLRGPSTFRVATSAPFRPSQVVEVTFVGKVRLPTTTEVLESTKGKWVPLFPTAG